ncbi:Fpg/Nei family DNA glycosylase [Auraticoccus monumenti]|uniref:Formamidopyrimidine-DNA glycosylase n=1 Tax=Auraticoccus monumenti TaxID=675864 RepID=A0A1G6VZI7_9ACTN|nr:DNA-formamidopyrimidine glycosylase family protein [Auraticoccus monumenti]SDD58978.1 formamidopyrimidine-DNA glycosylase [Auraticoccus monumenti]
MPELPEVESARATVEAGALGRRIAAVDDTDTWECRPHAPGDIEHALVGRVLTGAFRRGKSMWCETSDVGGEDGSGPVLGIHLGMSGRIVVTDGEGRSIEGGDWLGGRYGRVADQPDRKPEWDRFTLRFADGGELRLFDKRRLGRVRLDPDLSALGPDAQQVELAEFSARVGRGTAPVKARLLDQSVVAGVGNLLADETLWQARISPRRPAGSLAPDDLAVLHAALRAATEAAITHGGVHTGEVIEHRGAGGHCPRCGAELSRATVGGRTTFWCPEEQR